MAYRAVLTDAEVEREALLQLWTENLPVVGDVEAKLRWTYLDSPNGHGKAILLRDADGVAVGCAGVQLRELAYRGKVVRAALLGDFAVDRKHRTGVAALTLQRGVKRYVEAEYDLSYGFPNKNAVAIHRRTGYHELGHMDRYVRVLRSRRYLTQRYKRPGVAEIASTFIDPAMIAMTVVRGLRARATSKLVWLEDVDARFDRLWEAAHATYPILSRRSSALLRWRFLRKPDERNVIAALIDRGGAELRAYTVVHDEPGGSAVLADLFGTDLEAIDRLLGLLIPVLYRRGYETVAFRYLGDPRLRPVLAAHKFSLRDSRRAVIIHASPSWPIDRDARDANAWYITDLDEDT